jgi:hypothetical protein
MRVLSLLAAAKVNTEGYSEHTSVRQALFSDWPWRAHIDCSARVRPRKSGANWLNQTRNTLAASGIN